MTGRCAECRHWANRDDGLGVCAKITKLDEGPRIETACGYGGHLGDPHVDDASLVTPPEFGCALFEGKEEG